MGIALLTRCALSRGQIAPFRPGTLSGSSCAMSCWGDWATRKWKKRLSCAEKWRPGGPARTHPRLRGAPHAGAAGDAGAGNDETSKALAWVCGLKNASSAMVSRVRVGLPEWCLEGVVQRYKAAGAERESASTVVEIVRGKPPPARRQYGSSLVKTRNRDAAAFGEFSRRVGVDPAKAWPHGHFRRFLADAPGVKPSSGERMVALRRYFRRAVQSYAAQGSSDSALLVAVPRGNGQRALVANTHLRRLRGRQGRPKKAAIVGELLWEWFAAIRLSIVGRLPTTVVVSKAQQLCEDYIVESLRQGVDPRAPVVDGQWVRRWRVERGVSFRKPNRKWKVPKYVLLERCQIFWSNVFRVRAFIVAKFGYEPALWNFDQSPYHMNEAGSKETGTLALRGQPVVVLKEGHAATRARWSMTTMCVSDFEEAHTRGGGGASGRSAGRRRVAAGRRRPG